MIEVDWDSDDWVVFNSIGFQYSLYSLFGYYDASGTPIPVGDTIYYWNNINPPTNIVGYEYNSNRKRGIQTKYSYYSRKHIFFDNETFKKERAVLRQSGNKKDAVRLFERFL